MASKEKILAVSGLLSGAIIWGLIWYPYRLLEQMGISGALSSFATYLIPLILGFTLYSERVRLRHFPPILLLVGLVLRLLLLLEFFEPLLDEVIIELRVGVLRIELHAALEILE